MCIFKYRHTHTHTQRKDHFFEMNGGPSSFTWRSRGSRTLHMFVLVMSLPLAARECQLIGTHRHTHTNSLIIATNISRAIKTVLFKCVICVCVCGVLCRIAGAKRCKNSSSAAVLPPTGAFKRRANGSRSFAPLPETCPREKRKRKVTSLNTRRLSYYANWCLFRW